MGAQSKIGGYVADQADQIEQALRAAGLDPDGVRSWPYWNQFVDRGLRAALAAIHKNGGKSLRGLASPRYKHGKYSKDTLAMLTRAATAAATATDGRSPLAELLGDLLDTSAADTLLGNLANITNT